MISGQDPPVGLGAAPGGLAFAYHRSVSPMLWVMVGLSGIELLVSHFLLALWKPWVALGVSAISIIGIVWLIGIIRSFRSHPVLIYESWIHMRIGRVKAMRIPFTQVQAVLADLPPGRINQPDVMNMALLAHPNVFLQLDPPISRRVLGKERPTLFVGHRLDDLPAFLHALGELGRVDDRKQA